MAAKLIEVQTHAGTDIQHGSLYLTPYAQSLELHLPGGRGGLV